MKHNTGINTDENEVIPTIGMTGLFNLKSPYTNLVDPNTEYTCIAVTTLSNMIADNLEPLISIYIANGDTQENYELDLSKNRCIITLQSGTGTKIVIPNSALIILPKANGIKYRAIMLGVNLSVIPEDTDLTQLSQQIKDTIFNQLGVNSQVTKTYLGGSLLIDYDKHLLIQASRNNNIDEGTNPLLENEELKDTNSKLLQKIQVLEEWIKDHI
jgi:hypothetical protein